ncbi:MAG: hybrid sensor histidine kinase/response regulator [Chloroflexota bacterium]|nr:MAG: hybrid sensor histidine kinase/response regulator [Chloroflexota bacterium]
MEKRCKILIIDDEEIVLDSCLQILSGGDYEIRTAGNGILGVDLAEKFHPDVIFVDLKMPGISGFEVLEKIQEIDPTLVTIVITGFATIGSAVEAMQKGAFDFLPKPFTPDELRLITRRGIEKRKLVLETLALRREKELLREHFAAIVSHELKSPLAAVQQYLYSLSNELSDQLTEDQQHRFERIQTRIGDLMQLIHTWLRAITVDIESIKENFAPTSIPVVISKAVESVDPHAIRKDIAIRTAVQDDTFPVLGDEGTLVEAVVNIVGNAVKYSPAGSHVEITAKNFDDEVAITIEDDGIGISSDDLPFIFEDFYTSRSDKQIEKGSGVGLALTKRIIEAHGGNVSVESELGEGSTFELRFPALINQPIELSPINNEFMNKT